MATALQAFTNHEFGMIRTITSGGQILFCGRDVAATYTNYRRSSASFISSDCVVMDIDNDHTEEPSNWVTPETLGELMADMAFLTATSRNHQKPKGVVSARLRVQSALKDTAEDDR